MNRFKDFGHDRWDRELVQDTFTGTVYVFVDDVLHSRTDEGEPLAPVSRFDLDMAEVGYKLKKAEGGA